MALSGDLSEIGIKTLLGLIENTKGTGKITFISNFMNITVYFKNGRPVSAEGDKDPIASVEKLASFDKGSFEFVKQEGINETPDTPKVEETFKKIEEIKEKWDFVKAKFPSMNVYVDLAESKNEEVKISGDEWKILALIREPTTLFNLVKLSPLGELKTLILLASLFDKNLISIILQDDSLTEEDNVIPLKEAGWHAMNAPVYGEKSIEFYRKIDGRKDFQTIVKEMGISYKEGREIVRYLLSQGKIALRKKAK